MEFDKRDTKIKIGYRSKSFNVYGWQVVLFVDTLNGFVLKLKVKYRTIWRRVTVTIPYFERDAVGLTIFLILFDFKNR